ncbi:hypothetical protein [Streptomyces sp. NPDC005494]|uniref:hypothetical protein n=1 Tax=unclassified Streptomyces TaxID=2593676 RepID=UPI00367D4DAA
MFRRAVFRRASFRRAAFRRAVLRMATLWTRHPRPAPPGSPPHPVGRSRLGGRGRRAGARVTAT